MGVLRIMIRREVQGSIEIASSKFVPFHIFCAQLSRCQVPGLRSLTSHEVWLCRCPWLLRQKLMAISCEFKESPRATHVICHLTIFHIISLSCFQNHQDTVVDGDFSMR